MELLPRINRWVYASHTAAKYEPFMVPGIQGLGRLDHDLYEKDELLARNPMALSSSSDLGALSYHITMSYLWVLGAYEIIRSIQQRNKDTGLSDEKLTALLRKFERLRMPLAKFEPANRHKNTDSKIAYPALNELNGITWQISDEIFISRGELANEFLSLLEGWRAAIITGKITR